ncbi:Imm21 family immunity protein [Actinospica robiniae]|uniref:Imm21 family immunity protein n=1 Tax=Actinospica robiniae TaxID=304901 RepID=UPI00040FB1BE|nr:Imm21 family immunity protein [Actinospica robiniae]
MDGSIGLIDVGPARALIPGDEPAATTFHPKRNLLIRTIAIEPDTDLDALLDRVLPTVDWDEQLTWDVPGPAMLFESVYSYAQVIDEGEERLRIELAAGNHTVRAGYIQIPHEAWLILVQLTGPEAA